MARNSTQTSATLQDYTMTECFSHASLRPYYTIRKRHQHQQRDHYEVPLPACKFTSCVPGAVEPPE